MDDLVADFLAETREGLEQLDNNIVLLEQNPDDETLLGAIFRVMHTIKGTYGFLGLERLESISHAGENVLDKIRDGQLEVVPETISLILESIDAIKYIVGHIEKNECESEGNDKEFNVN